MDETDVIEVLTTSTVPDDLPLTVTGSFDSEQAARDLANDVMGIAKLAGTIFDLSALDGITIADDYIAALSSIERGYPGMKAPAASNDEFGTGQAMAVPVLRDGEHKSHVVVNSMLVRAIVEPDAPLYQFAVHTLFHEFAHVYDHMLRAKALPGLYGSQLTDLREATLMRLSMAAWDEYAASRLSAPWGTPEYCSDFEQGLIPMLETMLSRAEAAKIDFAAHRNTERTIAELGEVFGAFLIRAAYLVGHVDGVEGVIETEAPIFAEKLEATTWLKGIWNRYLEVLREMFGKIENWEDISAYRPLNQVFEVLLSKGGLQLLKLPTGGYYARFFKTDTL